MIPALALQVRLLFYHNDLNALIYLRESGLPCLASARVWRCQTMTLLAADDPVEAEPAATAEEFFYASIPFRD